MKPDEKLSLVISTTRGTHSFEFLGTTKIDEVIHEVRDHFGLAGGGEFALVKKDSGEQLEPVGRTLASFRLKDGEALVLTGGGVNV
ncbi:hypothetical protein [Candidatus Palauibacter sp.]|uniref:hypothetical protein n=1 Tax=Candidatus Palauibacter sp. TaxID=3101350 RepID=UPI003AF2D1A1